MDSGNNNDLLRRIKTTNANKAVLNTVLHKYTFFQIVHIKGKATCPVLQEKVTPVVKMILFFP